MAFGSCWHTPVAELLLLFVLLASYEREEWKSTFQVARFNNIADDLALNGI